MMTSRPSSKWWASEELRPPVEDQRPQPAGRDQRGQEERPRATGPMPVRW